jgi:hypothetical protein
MLSLKDKIRNKTYTKIIIKYASKQPRYSIYLSVDVSNNICEKIILKLVSKMRPPEFSHNKLGGPGSIVQIDETMLNYKC